jgi:hypothetical protein
VSEGGCRELGGYRLEAPVGRGGMSAVYRAEDLRLGRRVALKLLAAELAEDERFQARFLAESRLAASIDHPGIVPIFEAGEVEGLLYIAMRYIEGGDLRASRAAISGPHRERATGGHCGLRGARADPRRRDRRTRRFARRPCATRSSRAYRAARCSPWSGSSSPWQRSPACCSSATRIAARRCLLGAERQP